jgi:hypothetical protein
MEETGIRSKPVHEEFENLIAIGAIERLPAIQNGSVRVVPHRRLEEATWQITAVALEALAPRFPELSP